MRWDIPQTSGVVLAGWLLGCFSLPLLGTPNLLIIQTDEHHFNTLGCYGGKIVKTPHMDRIAKEGAICTSFYATTPVCSPSRGSLVTGLYPHHHQVVQNNIPLPDDTIIVFTSDHGDLCEEHGRLNKGNPYEGSARIPFLLRFPSKVPANTPINVALSCIDFTPTVFSLMGIRTLHVFDGRDASPWFRGKTVEDWKDIIFLRSTTGQRWLCAVSDRFKLVYSNKERPWLMDLTSDPEEAFNHIDEPAYTSIVRSMTQSLLKYCDTQKDPFGQVPEIVEAMHRPWN